MARYGTTAKRPQLSRSAIWAGRVFAVRLAFALIEHYARSCHLPYIHTETCRDGTSIMLLVSKVLLKVGFCVTACCRQHGDKKFAEHGEKFYLLLCVGAFQRVATSYRWAKLSAAGKPAYLEMAMPTIRTAAYFAVRPVALVGLGGTEPPRPHTAYQACSSKSSAEL